MSTEDAPPAKRAKIEQPDGPPAPALFDDEDDSSDDDQRVVADAAEVDPLLYDDEGYLDDADRDKLDELNDIERERVLADRLESKDRAKMIRTLRAQRGELDDEEEEEDDDLAKLEAKKKRAQAAAAAHRKQQAQRLYDSDEEDNYESDSGESGETESEWEDERADASLVKKTRLRRKATTRKTPSAKTSSSRRKKVDDDYDDYEEEFLDLSTLNDMRLTRGRLLKWMDEPRLIDAIVGAFVRVRLDKNEGYAVRKILNVRRLPEYYDVLGEGRANIELLLTSPPNRPNSKPTWERINSVSGAMFTNADFEFFRRGDHYELTRIKDARELDNSVDEFILARKYTPEEFAMKNSFRRMRKNKVYNSVSAKADLERKLKACDEEISALCVGGTDVERLTEAVARKDNLVENMKKLDREIRERTKRKLERMSERNAAAVNRRNVRENLRTLKQGPNKLFEGKTSSERTDMRRPTRPSQLWAVGSQGEKRVEKAAVEEAAAAAAVQASAVAAAAAAAAVDETKKQKKTKAPLLTSRARGKKKRVDGKVHHNTKTISLGDYLANN